MASYDKLFCEVFSIYRHIKEGKIKDIASYDML